MKYFRVRIAIICITLIGIMSACSNTTTPTGPVAQRWAVAVTQEQYAAAERMMQIDNVAQWRETTEGLRGAHGKIQGFSLSATSQGPGDNYRVEFHWNDGTTRCMYFEVVQQEHVRIQGDFYQACP
ncbi:MAG: hypothetical protein MUD01_19595 [Chloroflexaceae bacterium]|nr:hypothetical protein [Chloroflexaceae bacterium]